MPPAARSQGCPRRWPNWPRLACWAKRRRWSRCKRASSLRESSRRPPRRRHRPSPPPRRNPPRPGPPTSRSSIGSLKTRAILWMLRRRFSPRPTAPIPIMPKPWPDFSRRGSTRRRA
ncbi:hypothetical protein VZ95_09530 [Elstera litoralis]|uniref:Uncharacterized protein n=1 Tax=Elstera litoralis TaxID=552518 RepID=A0A0F3IT71_9PROT|nr:hypothetical protein VZ95_09530 [Elstera litoralis]